MHKVLLISNVNDIINSVYTALLSKYQVQLCKMENDIVERMLKGTEPDIAFLCMEEDSDFDTQIFEYFRQVNSRIPIIFVGKYEEYRKYAKLYEDGPFEFLEALATQEELLKKCGELLKETEEKKEEEKEKKPMKEKPKTAEPVASAGKASLRKRILVVDDSGIFLRIVKSQLEPRYEVILAKSGEKAITTARVEIPDLILLDYEMPGLDGKETLEKLRQNEKTANIPVIFLTAVSDRSHIVAALKLQPQGYILKPVDGKELEKKIVETIG